jgi:hypothetical protein
MTDARVVNLNKARKARAKTQARAEADQNAARFGRTRAQREAEAQAAEKAARTLDAHRRDPGDDTDAIPT